MILDPLFAIAFVGIAVGAFVAIRAVWHAGSALAAYTKWRDER